MEELISEAKNCQLCADLPLGINPIFQTHASAKILIAGQAPGRITHEKNIPFDDPSGRRLRDWMGVTDDEFYDATKVAILPMGFCFPGSGKSGDLPPRPECAPAWRQRFLDAMPQIELTLIIGQYAIDWHVNDGQKRTLTSRVLDWEEDLPQRLLLPHPSPRNNRWLARNHWFDQDVLPVLKHSVRHALRV